MNLIAYFNTILANFPNSTIIFILLLSIIYWDANFLLLGSLLIVFGPILNQILKYLLRGLTISKRPNICGLVSDKDNTCSGCGVIIACKKTASSGMPSGHAQYMGILSIFITIYLLKNNEVSTKLVAQITSVWILTLLICYQRYISKCHTILQITIGLVVGCICGVLSYIIYSSISMNQLNHL
jgi:membrane-associated phospholipid phosphatase